MEWTREKINSFKILTRTFYDYQHERMSIDNRLGMTKAGDVKKKAPPRDDVYLVTLMERRVQVLAMEEGVAKDIAKEVHSHPLWENFLSGVKGCGEQMAAVLITEIDIRKAVAVSNIWSFAGLAPGKDRLVKGQKCTFNQFLRAKVCGVLGGSFLRSGSPYRQYYDNMRHRLESKDWGMEAKNPSNKEKPKAFHQHKAANRYMVKMFLRDLYVAWRTIEGLPVREPYQEQYLGHAHGGDGEAA